MKQTFHKKSVLIVGATGGLGGAAAQAFSSAGARLLLAGRDTEKLQRLGVKFSVPVFHVDMADPESVEELKNSVTPVDVVVNLTGTDIRKPLGTHSIEEIQRLISVNLAGSIYLTRSFLPQMKSQQSGTILHVGGFADGRLVFPFYSVDAATRAGVSILSLNP